MRKVMGIGLILSLAACALAPQRPVGVVVEAEPEGAMVLELGTDRTLHAAPAAIYYDADELPTDYRERGCFRVAGFAAVWPDGTAVRTPALVDICREGNAPARIVLRQPLPTGSEADPATDLERAVAQYLETGQARPLRCLRMSVAEGFSLICE